MKYRVELLSTLVGFAVIAAGVLSGNAAVAFFAAMVGTFVAMLPWVIRIMGRVK